jgi:hypothetical protein
MISTHYKNLHEFRAKMMNSKYKTVLSRLQYVNVLGWSFDHEHTKLKLKESSR